MSRTIRRKNLHWATASRPYKEGTPHKLHKDTPSKHWGRPWEYRHALNIAWRAKEKARLARAVTTDALDAFVHPVQKHSAELWCW